MSQYVCLRGRDPPIDASFVEKAAAGARHYHLSACLFEPELSVQPSCPLANVRSGLMGSAVQKASHVNISSMNA